MARHGPDVLWPAQRALNPVSVSRPRVYVEQLSADSGQLGEDGARLAATLCIVTGAVSLLLLELVSVATLHGAAEARTAYTTGDSVLAEVTDVDDEGLQLVVAGKDEQGRSRDAVACVDYPEDYSLGRRYPAVVLPDDPGLVWSGPVSG